MKRSSKQFYYCFAALLVLHLWYVVVVRTRYDFYFDVQLRDWRREKPRNFQTYTNGSASFRVVPQEFCRQDTLLVIIIHSSPAHFAQRKAIRTTWAKKEILNKLKIEAFFMLGRPSDRLIQRFIINESRAHRDIIEEDFVDNYSNLTLKSVYMLKVFASRSHGCKFLMKVDEDVLLNVHRIRRNLPRIRNRSNLLVGRLIRREKPIRKFRRRWYSPRYMYARRTYPDFLAGPAYLMSRDVAFKLFNSALQLPLFHLEDVFLTGICARHANVSPTNNRLFVDYRVSPKHFHRKLTIHGVDPLALARLDCNFEPLRCAENNTNDGDKVWYFSNKTR